MTKAAAAAKLMEMIATFLLAVSLGAAPAKAADSVPNVSMDEYIVARAADYPAVRTDGVATCIAVALYDPTTQTGALAHLSAEAQVGPSLEIVLRGLLAAGAQPGNVRAQVIGGWRTSADGPMGFQSTSPEILAGIVKFLSRHSIPVSKQETLVEPGFKPGSPRAIRNLNFDLRTGQLDDYEPTGTGPAPDRSAQNARFARTHLLSRHPLSLDAPK
jgi:chemotaxis receptor (MCP) glutamine deamidase CheD